MIHEKSKTFFLQTGGVHCGYCTPFTLINMNLFVTPKTYKISGEKENSMGFFKELKKATKEASEEADRRIAEKRAREAEEAEKRKRDIDKRLDRAAKAAAGRIKAPRTIDDGENHNN